MSKNFHSFLYCAILVLFIGVLRIEHNTCTCQVSTKLHLQPFTIYLFVFFVFNLGQRSTFRICLLYDKTCLVKLKKYIYFQIIKNSKQCDIRALSPRALLNWALDGLTGLTFCLENSGILVQFPELSIARMVVGKGWRVKPFQPHPCLLLYQLRRHRTLLP